MKKITMREIKACYAVSKKVYDKKLSFKDAVSQLVDKWNMAPYSAMNSVDFFLYLMEGQVFPWVPNRFHVAYCLEQILKDYGQKQVKKAFNSMDRTIKHYDGVKNLSRVRDIQNEFRAKTGL